MTKPKFVIGIGSQRAGSTLLHRILDECTDIFMHPVKELHYFDTLYNVRHQDVLTKYSQRQFNREFDRIITSKNHDFMSNKKYKCFLRTNKILANKKVRDVDYLDLYRPCLLESDMVGEITPEYMILPEEGVKHMSEVLGKETPIILITRDPVDRFISAFKLLKAYGNDNVDMSNFEEELLEVFDTMPSWVEQQKQLNDYKTAESRFRKCFDNVLVISYQDIATEIDKTLGMLSQFLNADIDLEKYSDIVSRKVNQIGLTSEISKISRKKISDFLLS